MIDRGPGQYWEDSHDWKWLEENKHVHGLGRGSKLSSKVQILVTESWLSYFSQKFKEKNNQFFCN